MRLRYARHWLQFKIVQAFRPYRSITPAYTVQAWRIERTPFGFIIWGGQKRRHYSWRFWCEGPCNFATFAYFSRKRS